MTETPRAPVRKHRWLSHLSLKFRLGIGAALLGIGTLITALILWVGMEEVASRLEASIAAEERMAGYSMLSQQTAKFLVVSTEAIQTELPPATRRDRIAPIAAQLRETFAVLERGVEEAVANAAALGLDAQSRFATQSLGLARMSAQLTSAERALASDQTNKLALRTHIDTFASNFDPLLSQAVNTEVLFRSEILSGISDLRQRLTGAALAITLATLLLVALFQFLLVRPQFRRLDRLALAARQIGSADFAVALPSGERDEIGQLYFETNRMAAALAQRQSEVETEWAQLNQTIDERTEALRSANARLAEIDENRRRFFADVSHELRTPLTVILMEAQIGLRESANPAFQTIEQRVARLNRRIDDLLRVARSESGQLVMERTSLPLDRLLGEVVQEVEAEIANAGMELTHGPWPDATLNCDQNWMRQVIVSLIRNAIRHAREGRVLSVTAQTDGAMVVIAVADNGRGIAAEDQARVFERFAQGAGSAPEGFGIGLALVAWVVKEHGGSIEIESPIAAENALGEHPGTKVVLRLPRETG